MCRIGGHCLRGASGGNGPDNVLPSLSSTRNVSSETSTSNTSGIRISSIEVLIPRLHDPLAMFLDQPRNSRDFRGPKPPLNVSESWAIHTRLRLMGGERDLALFNLRTNYDAILATKVSLAIAGNRILLSIITAKQEIIAGPNVTGLTF